MQSRPPLVCAHGGDVAAAPPNTARAFAAAIEAGADCVEVCGPDGRLPLGSLRTSMHASAGVKVHARASQQRAHVHTPQALKGVCWQHSALGGWNRRWAGMMRGRGRWEVVQLTTPQGSSKQVLCCCWSIKHVPRLQIDAARTADDELVVMHVRELHQLMPDAPAHAQVGGGRGGAPPGAMPHLHLHGRMARVRNATPFCTHHGMAPSPAASPSRGVRACMLPAR